MSITPVFLLPGGRSRLAYRHDFHVRVVDIEGGKDPADIVLKDPKSVARRQLRTLFDSIAFFLKKSLSTHHGSLDSLAKKNIGREILPLVS